MKPSLFAACLVSALALAVGALQASDPIGVYCAINKVVFEPNERNPTSVQVWGAFTFAVPGSWGSGAPPAGGFGDAPVGDVYGPVQVGYLYFDCAVPNDIRCTNQWRDLKLVAGGRKIVGIGGRYVNNGRVRPSTEPPANPNIYPLGFGVVPIGFSPRTLDGSIPDTKAMPGPYQDMMAALSAAAWLAKQ